MFFFDIFSSCEKNSNTLINKKMKGEDDEVLMISNERNLMRFFGQEHLFRIQFCNEAKGEKK